MKQTTLITTSLIIACIGVVVSFPASACDEQSKHIHDQELLAQSAAQAGMAASALRLIEDGDIEKAKAILQFQLSRGLTSVGDLTNQAAPPKVANPNLVESLVRAKSYVQEHALDPELVEAADKAIKYLDLYSAE